MELDGVRDPSGEVRRDHDVLGEGAVHGVAGVLLALTERLPAADAVAAAAASTPEPRNGDPVADRPGGDRGADPLDVPDAFVPGDEGRCRLDRPVALRGVDVRVAEPAGLDADEHLARPRLGGRDVLDLEGGVEISDDGCLHDASLPLSDGWRNRARAS